MWDSFDEKRRMHKEMDRMFRSFFEKPELTTSTKELTKSEQPSSDIEETDNEVIATIDLPGVDKKDILLTVRDDLIEVKAEKKQEMEIKKKNLYRHERSHSGFYRTLPLPAKVDAENAEAEYKDGVLKVKIAKKEKIKLKGKKIEIK